MKPYKNLSGNSGILAYEIAADSIQIKFIDGHIYLYTYSNPGKRKVESMKKLAELGKGLATFINQHIRDNYEAKIK